MNWRYLMVGRGSLLVRHHRQLWWSSLPGVPRAPWLILELWLWLRWQLYGGWRSCWQAIHRWGPQVAAEDGLSRVRQFRLIAPMVLGWCIPASELYRLRCHARPGDFLQYVYSHEATAFHRWRSGGSSRHSLALLQDKARLSRHLLRRSLPMVPILAQVPRHSGSPLTYWLSPGRAVFCKHRRGQGGRGAFAAWWEQGELRGWAFTGQHLLGDEVTAAWRWLLRQDDVLVQPRLITHPVFDGLVTGEDVSTVRFISVLERAEPRYLCAMLELSMDPTRFGGGSYLILLVSPETGRVEPFPEAFLPAEARAYQARCFGSLRELVIPGWQRIVAGSLRSHRSFPDCWAIAWDWAITADGPWLLEGNAGWSPTIPQVSLGGLLMKG